MTWWLRLVCMWKGHQQTTKAREAGISKTVSSKSGLASLILHAPEVEFEEWTAVFCRRCGKKYPKEVWSR